MSKWCIKWVIEFEKCYKIQSIYHLSCIYGLLKIRKDGWSSYSGPGMSCCPKWSTNEWEEKGVGDWLMNWGCSWNDMDTALYRFADSVTLSTYTFIFHLLAQWQKRMKQIAIKKQTKKVIKNKKCLILCIWPNKPHSSDSRAGSSHFHFSPD